MKKEKLPTPRKTKKLEKASQKNQQQDTENKDQEDKVQSKNDKQPSILDKQLDEQKIIKQFQTKRKMLMKALKQKQKSKNPKLLTIEEFQSKEGEQKSEDCQHKEENLNNQDAKMITQQKKNSNISNYKSSGLIRIDPKQGSGKKKSTAIQTQVFVGKTKKINKEPKNFKINNNHELEHLVKSNNILSQKKWKKSDQIDSGLKKKKIKKSPEDIEKIKSQLNRLLAKNGTDNQYATDSNSLSVPFSNSPLSVEFYQSQVYSSIQRLNFNIESYYKDKKVKQVILDRFIEKYNRKNIWKKKQGLLNSNETSRSDMIQSSKSEIQNSLEISKNQKVIDQTKHKQYQNQNSKLEEKKQQKNLGKVKKPRKKPINQRFKIPGIQKENQMDISNEVRNVSTKRPQDQSSKYDLEENKTQNEDFDAIQNWKNQFRESLLVMFKRYPDLKKQVSGRWFIEQQYKTIQTEHKKEINRYCMKKKIITKQKETMKLSNGKKVTSFIEQDKSVPVKQILKAQATKIKSKKTLKQIEIGANEQDQFGKSFDQRSMSNSKSSLFERSVKSNSLDNVLNDSNSKNSQQMFISSNKTAFKYLVQQKQVSRSFQIGNSQSSSQKDEIKQENMNPSNSSTESHKVMIKQNAQWSLFRGENSKQYLYMSQEIV